MTKQLIITALSQPFSNMTDEKVLQNEIAERFMAHQIPFQREVSVEGGVIDFIVGNIGIEVKIKGGKRAIYRQCEAYTQDDEIKEFILLTSKTCQIPEQINGVECTVLSLSAGWL